MTEHHTPSPWLVRFEPDDLDSSASDLRVLDSRSLDHPQGPLTIAVINVAAHAPHLAEPLANAALIAAAPELLAALQNADKLITQLLPGVKHIALQDYGFLNDTMLANRAAIAKATGAEQ